MQDTAAVRPGEELDQERLAEFLNANDFVVTELDVKQFPAGSSNLTYLIRVDDCQLVLRRPPFGNAVKTAHDMQREFNVLSKLSAVYPPAPKPILFCDDTSVIGAEFYLMERRHGVIIRGSFATAGASARALHDLENSQRSRQKVCAGFINNLASLHSLDLTSAGLTDLGRPEGYNRRQVEGWSRRYLAAATEDSREMESSISWLNDNTPRESGAALVHNDYKFDNVMLDPDDLSRITAVLDWEMVTVGDPLMDLGTTLGYWMSRDAGEKMLSMPFNPRVLMENITRGELVEMYAAASGSDVNNILFYYVFGTFKIAVIAQQIYARYMKGFTQDERFGNFNKFVTALGSIAADAIARKSL